MRFMSMFFVLLTVLASVAEAQNVTVTGGGHVNEGGSASFTVSLACPSFDVTVSYSTEDGSAISGEDYSSTSGTLTLSCSGSSTGSVSVSITDDSDYEGDETFYVEFIDSDTFAAYGSISVTIGDDDPDDPTTWTHDPIDYETTVPVYDEEKEEWVAVDTTLVGVNPCGPEVAFADKARDYLCECYYTYDEGFQLYYDENDGKMDPERTYFSCDEGVAGVLYGYKQVRVYDDYNDSYYYEYDLNSFGEIEIVENPPFGGEPLTDKEYEEHLDYTQLPGLSVSVEDATGYEDSSGEYGDGSLTFTVTMDRPSTKTAVKYITVDGSATAGEDYVATSGRLDFNVSQSHPLRVSRTFTVQVLNDNLYEGGDETFTVRITDPSDGSVLAEATGTIWDDGVEGVYFRSGVSDKEYMAGVWISPDYLPSAIGGLGRLTYSLGGLPDGLLFDGPDRRIYGQPADGSIGKHEVTYIVEDDDTGGSDSVTFTVTVVEYDYDKYFGELEPTELDAALASVLEEAEESTPVIVTRVDEVGDSTKYQITLGQYIENGGSTSDLYLLDVEDEEPVIAVMIVVGYATVEDDETPPEEIISGPSIHSSVEVDDVVSDVEHGLMTFTVKLDPAPSVLVGVKYATSTRTAVAGEDYKAVSGTLYFDPGQSEAEFTVRILRDDVDESDETFAVRITHPSTGVLLAEATGTITDDDGQDEAASSSSSSAPFAFAEEVRDQAYTVGRAIRTLQLPEAVDGDGEITYRVSGLPSGLSFDDSTRTISGTPATNGTAAITYMAEDDSGDSATLTFTITVSPDPSSALVNLLDLFAGKATTHSQLFQNAPNPFNSQTVLSYFLRHPSSATVEVFSLTGQRVALLHQGPQQPGVHRLHWNGRDDFGRPVASGMYLYRLVTDERVLTRKLILLR